VASREAVAEARGLGSGAAAAILSGILNGHVAWSMDRSAERAADLAGRLRLVGAIPALIRCLDRLSDFDPVANAALGALTQLRGEATGPLLESYRRCPTVEDRCLRATVLARACVRDGRVRVALTELLAENPRAAAGALGEHGDRDAVPALGAALDRLEPLAPDAPGELERLEEIVAVAQAIRLLRGKRSKAQEAKFRNAYARSDEIWARGGPEEDESVSS
jgi:hypothetical protein